MKQLFLFILIIIHCNTSIAQVNNSLQLTTGFNRVGFFNEVTFKFGINRHKLKLGLRHYTLDNFFEKNTIGLSLNYNYNIEAKNEKVYFYPGISTNFFMENKNNAKVFLSEYKIINGVGMNINKNWSVFYQLGFGVILTKSYLPNIEEPTQLEYFNYEMAVGICYHFKKKGEKHYLKQ